MTWAGVPSDPGQVDRYDLPATGVPRTGTGA